MNRPIKFRAWDTDKKAMLPAQDLTQARAHWTWLGEFDFPLMQFTGLTDKNGREIYEGDIISNWQASANEVFWDECGFAMRNYHAGSLPFWSYAASSVVVGNVFENPDLIA